MELSFGDRILLLRKKRGCSQKELAERIGVSSTRLAKWEGDTERPPLDKAGELADALDISLDFLACRVEEQPEMQWVRKGEEVEGMDQERKRLLHRVIDLFIRDHRNQKNYSE